MWKHALASFGEYDGSICAAAAAAKQLACCKLLHKKYWYTTAFQPHGPQIENQQNKTHQKQNHINNTFNRQ